MPTQKTSPANKPARTYTDQNDKDPQADERGKRALKPSTDKKDIGKDVNKKLPGSVGMTEAKPGNEESDQFASVRKTIATLHDSHDVEDHAKALTESGKPEHAKPAPSKASKGK